MSRTSGGKAIRDRDGAVGLRYVGQGAALPDVPARDLSADEVTGLDRKALLASGLYADDDTPAPAEPAESE